MNATPKETTELAALNPTRYEFSYRNSFNDKYSADRDIDPDGEYIEYTPEVQEAIAAWNRRTAPSIPAQPAAPTRRAFDPSPLDQFAERAK